MTDSIRARLRTLNHDAFDHLWDRVNTAVIAHQPLVIVVGRFVDSKLALDAMDIERRIRKFDNSLMGYWQETPKPADFGELERAMAGRLGIDLDSPIAYDEDCILCLGGEFHMVHMRYCDDLVEAKRVEKILRFGEMYGQSYTSSRLGLLKKAMDESTQKVSAGMLTRYLQDLSRRTRSMAKAKEESPLGITEIEGGSRVKMKEHPLYGLPRGYASVARRRSMGPRQAS